MANTPTTPDDMGQVRSDEGSIPARNGHIGRIVAGSLATGVVAALLALAIWMTLQAHRQLHSRTRRWLLYPVIAVMALASVGGGYETVREHLDASAYPMTGQLIDVGGYRLHIHCTGSGSPTVVL